MKNRMYAVIALLVLVMSFSVSTYAENLEPQGGVHLGYFYAKGKPYAYSHNTHPGDTFLPNASTPGSAGKTEIDGGLNFLEIGFDGYLPVANDWAFNAGFSGLFGGVREAHQNDNDPRPPASSASVYSQVQYGATGSIGFGYYSEYFDIGIEGRETMLYYESGWDRFGRDGRAYREFRWTPSYGPKIGIGPVKNFRIESGLYFSNEGFVGANAHLLFRFQ